MKRSLEINIISAENLSLHEKPVRGAFVAVRADSDPRCTTTMTRAAAKEKATGNPQWNEKLRVELPRHAGSITLEVLCKSSPSNDTLIGEARVPVSDFVGPFAPENHMHFLSYRLRDSDGTRNGVINISVKVAAPLASRCVRPTSRTGLGVPPQTHVRKAAVEGVVTGIPVWLAQPCRY